MSLILRILLVFMSVLATIYAVRKIRYSQMKIENAIFWFGVTFLILFLSLFPHLMTRLSNAIGVQSPVNLVYLVMIFLLFYKVFRLAMRNAQLEHKTNILAEEIAIIKNKMKNEEKE